MSATDRLQEELHRIPRVAVVIAAVVFVGMTWLALILFGNDEDTRGMWVGLQIVLSLAVATAVAIYVLLIGYVNVDAKRRSMNRVLWTLLVIFVPNALGFIVYFLVRSPVSTECPDCGNVVSADSRYCAKCGRQLGEVCPACHRRVEPRDTFCSSCGQRLRETAAG